MTRYLRLLILCALTLSAHSAAHAQVSLTLDIKRRLYMRYEPILATVKITNLSGRNLLLEDGDQAWFGFDVTGGNTETLVPPRNADYRLEPLELKLGETVKRTVNLTSLYGIAEYGLFRIKATVYVKEMDKLFASKPEVVEISEGRTIWKQTVGVPETLPNAGNNHTIKLLEFQRDKRYLYIRVEDEEMGRVFCTYRAGHMIDGTNPQVQLDTSNNVYVLHLVGPKTYLLTNVGVNGEFLGQTTYTAPKSRPYFRRLADGTVQLVGGKREAQTTAANGAAPDGPPPIKLSDRPAGLPAN